MPGPPYPEFVSAKPSNFRHKLGEGVAVRTKSVLSGLHHEYFMMPVAARSAMESQKTA